MFQVILKVHLNTKKMRLFLVKEGLFFGLSGFGDNHFNSRKGYNGTHFPKEIYRLDDKRFNWDTSLHDYDYYVPVIHQRTLKAFVLLGTINKETELINHDLNFIQTLIGLIVVAQDNKKLSKDKIERKRLERELELGREVQQMLIPNQLIQNEYVELNAWYQPHESIGGDFYDFQVNDKEMMWCIADVSGKGISAALLMANLQASLRAWFSITTNPLEIIKHLNELIWLNTRGDRYITLFLGIYHPGEKTLKYVNAGHQPAILIQSNNHQLLKKGTVMLGAFEELPFLEMGTARLSAGDLIFNYTDGLLERKNVEEHIPQEKVVDFLKNQQLPLSEMHQVLLKTIRNSLKNKALSDDLTLLSIKVK